MRVPLPPSPINVTESFQTGLLPRKNQKQVAYDEESGEKSDASEALARRADNLALKVASRQLNPKL